MEKPIVSVIMGVYNAEKTVDAAIESIISQTYEKWELIICDDCSEDSTWDHLNVYKNKDERIRLLKNEKNYKLAATLNRCLSIAKGKYIARMDADDISLSERFEKQVWILDNSGFDVVGCAAKISDGNSIQGIRICKEYPEENDVLNGTPFIHPSIMMKKEVYDQLGGYTVSRRTIRGQDWDLWFRFFAHGYKGYNICEPLIVYYERKSDLKKRTLKAAVGTSKTVYNGFRLLKVPYYKYYLILKPIISYFIPEIIKKNMRGESIE